MKIRSFTALILMYVFWILMFVIQKPLFMLSNPVEDAVFSDWIAVIAHGVKLDACFASYFLFIPVAACLVNTFLRFNIRKFLYIYNIILAVAVTVLFAVDAVLYSYWGFRMDATLIFYLKDFSESLNSVTLQDVVKFLLIAVPYFLIVLFTYRFVFDKSPLIESKRESNLPLWRKIVKSLLLVVYIPLLIVFTRGGVSTATANIGMVYYSSNQKLNLAAVNPAFSLLYSLGKTEDFAHKYKFYDDEFAKREFEKLLSHDNAAVNDDNELKQSFLSTDRPNVLVIILESFTANIVKAIDGEFAVAQGMEVTENLNKIAEESLVFDRAYSNGMRTDRGIVSILTGFPAQPDMSIIKYPEKTRTLPSMAKTLSSAGYNTQMLYGGDINFANMRSFFYSGGYKSVTDYRSFDVKYRLSKWGVNDAVTFSYLYDLLQENAAQKDSEGKIKPFFTTFLTLSSHEPFDVDMRKFSNPYLNSAAYTDSCLGVFINKLKQTDLWQNMLVVLVADHWTVHPAGLSREDSRLYRVPVIFTGGAVTVKKHIGRLVNQTDIPKTVLTAMNLPCEDFVYSRDVFNPSYQDYAMYVYTTGFGFMDSRGLTVWDKDAGKVIYGEDKQREMKGKVLLQILYQDIARR